MVGVRRRNDAGRAHRACEGFRRYCTASMAFYDQDEFEIRCEWGQRGIEVLAACSDVVIIVDVCSFSTSVDVAVSRGAMVFPYRWKDQTAMDYAKSVRAELI